MVSVFLSTDVDDDGILIVTRFAKAFDILLNELKSFVDFAKCFPKLLLTDILTEPFFSDFICEIFSRFSLNKTNSI